MAIPLQYDPESLKLADKPKFLGATDGDTPTIETPIRMLGMDAPELHYGGASSKTPHKYDERFARFLGREGKSLDKDLQAYLRPRLSSQACSRHISAGEDAFSHYTAMVQERLGRGTSPHTGRKLTPRRLFTMVSTQVFDRYGRMLAYIAPAYTREERDATPESKRPTFNLQMLRDGHATSLLIYPNVPKPADLLLVRKAVADAKNRQRGLWKSQPPLLHASEFRWIIDMIVGKRNGPDRYCGDFTTARLYPPQLYYRVPDENRLWFFPEHLGHAVTMGFELQV